MYKMVLKSRLQRFNKSSTGKLVLDAYQNLLDLLTIKAKESDGDKTSLHDEIVIVLFDFGYTYEKLQRFDEAITLYNKCLKVS